MLWLEMSRDYNHGGGSWGFTHSLWAPTFKLYEDGRMGGRWPFWENILKVQADDVVLHLREDKTVAFVGYSVAETDGYKTAERPPKPGRWGYDTHFYRVLLKDFISFPTPFELREVFQQHERALRSYFERNKNKPIGQKRSLFYVIQAGRLQCLNGAYLSEVDDELYEILFGSSQVESEAPSHLTLIDVKTNERIRELQVRIGQKDFSERIRANYDHCCCFPKCTFSEDRFLIGSHIARWSDVPEFRGNLSNGLCFCLVHDKAFEVGFFTVDKNLCVLVNPNNTEVKKSRWCETGLLPYNGQPIRRGHVLPSQEALSHHWKRINIQMPDMS